MRKKTKTTKAKLKAIKSYNAKTRVLGIRKSLEYCEALKKAIKGKYKLGEIFTAGLKALKITINIKK